MNGHPGSVLRGPSGRYGGRQFSRSARGFTPAFGQSGRTVRKNVGHPVECYKPKIDYMYRDTLGVYTKGIITI